MLKMLLLTAGGVLLTAASLTAFLLLFALLAFKRAVLTPASKSFEAAVVLGFPASEDGRPSPIMRERVMTAAELYKKGLIGKILLSGGSVYNRFVEAEVMRELAVSLGVPSSDIITEGRSRYTYDNLRKSSEKLKALGIDSALVITSPWHARRAYYYMGQFDFGFSLAVSAPPPEYGPFRLFLIHLFECFTLLKTKLKGY